MEKRYYRRVFHRIFPFSFTLIIGTACSLSVFAFFFIASFIFLFPLTNSFFSPHVPVITFIFFPLYLHVRFSSLFWPIFRFSLLCLLPRFLHSSTLFSYFSYLLSVYLFLFFLSLAFPFPSSNFYFSTPPSLPLPSPHCQPLHLSPVWKPLRLPPLYISISLSSCCLGLHLCLLSPFLPISSLSSSSVSTLRSVCLYFFLFFNYFLLSHPLQPSHSFITTTHLAHTSTLRRRNIQNTWDPFNWRVRLSTSDGCSARASNG